MSYMKELVGSSDRIVITGEQLQEGLKLLFDPRVNPVTMLVPTDDGKVHFGFFDQLNFIPVNLADRDSNNLARRHGYTFTTVDTTYGGYSGTEPSIEGGVRMLINEASKKPEVTLRQLIVFTNRDPKKKPESVDTVMRDGDQLFRVHIALQPEENLQVGNSKRTLLKRASRSANFTYREGTIARPTSLEIRMINLANTGK